MKTKIIIGFTLISAAFSIAAIWIAISRAPLRSGDVDVDSPFDTGIGSVPRIIYTPELPNLRDIGGWQTSGGGIVRQGLVFRTSCFNDDYEWYRSGVRTHQITEQTRLFLVEKLNIRTDLDLRAKDALKGMEHSPLGNGVKLVNIPSLAYGDIATETGGKAIVAALRVLLEPGALPLAVHCKAGKDRGGSFVFVLNGLLGVEEESLHRDWELSALWHPSIRSDEFQRKYKELLAVTDTYPGATLQERISAYVKSHGLSEQEIARLKEIFLAP